MIDLLKQHPFFSDRRIRSCVLLENQGYCNENYLITTKTNKYVARKFLRDDIDRGFEWKVQQLAFQEGITAEPLVYDEAHEFMVFEFLEGEHKNTLAKNELKVLAEALQKLHSIRIDAKPIELYVKNKRDEILKAFETLNNFPKENVLCHNDLNPQNIFFFNNVKFIDWEYTGVNDRYFDLACVCIEFKLNNGMQKVFLNTYFEDEHFMLEKLKAYKIIYEALCREWFDSSL